MGFNSAFKGLKVKRLTQTYSLCTSRARPCLIHAHSTVLRPCWDGVDMDRFETDFSRPKHRTYRRPV